MLSSVYGKHTCVVPMSLAREQDEYEKDSEGIQTMRRLGENIVWLLERIN